MAVSDDFDWMSLLNRGLSTGAGLYDLFGKGGQSSYGITKTAAEAANPFGSQFQQYQAPLAQTTLQPQTNPFGAGRQNLFGQYTGTLTAPTTNQFGAGRSNLFGQLSGQISNPLTTPYGKSQADLFGQYQGLLADPNKFTSDPFYQWQQQQGLGNLERSLAGRGLLDSGNALTEITQFGQGLAGQSYGNRLAQLLGGAEAAGGMYQQGVGNLAQGTGLAGNLYQADVGNLMQGVNTAGTQYGDDWQRLMQLSGVQQGSPAAAGQILAGRFANRNNALANIGFGLDGTGGVAGGGGSNPLNQLINRGINKGIQGISDWFGGGGASGATALTDAYLSGQITADQLPWIANALEGGGDLGASTVAQALQNPNWGGLDFLGTGGEAAGSFGAGSEAAAAGAGGAATFGAGDTAANLAAFYGGYAPAGAAGTAGTAGAGSAAATGGAAGEAGLSGLGTLGGFAAAAALPALGYGLTAHQWAKDDARRAEAEQQYLPALRNWITSHPEAIDEYKRLLTLYGGGDWGLGRSVAGQQMKQKYPELTRIVSENWLPGFLYQEYGSQLGDLSQYQAPKSAMPWTGTMGDA